ncbi:MAG TPA: hypothetical protein V6D33_04975 [Cyanophyceae cyanobacterium]
MTAYGRAEYGVSEVPDINIVTYYSVYRLGAIGQTYDLNGRNFLTPKSEKTAPLPSEKLSSVIFTV